MPVSSHCLLAVVGRLCTRLEYELVDAESALVFTRSELVSSPDPQLGSAVHIVHLLIQCLEFTRARDY